jgi:hypothetical protein
MGKLIYLDHYRLREPDLPPISCCGGLIRPYVVDPSVPPKPRPAIMRSLKDPCDGSLGSEQVPRF